MDRRNFFASVAGFFAWLWALMFARKAAALPAPPKVLVEVLPGPVPEGPYRVIGNPPSHAKTNNPWPYDGKHTDIFVMLEEISEHTKATGDTIFSCDYPMEFPPRLGFVALGSDDETTREWSIRVGDIAESLTRAEQEEAKQALENSLLGKPAKTEPWPPPPAVSAKVKRQLISRYIQTQDGRSALAMSFPGQRKTSRPV